MKLVVLNPLSLDSLLQMDLSAVEDYSSNADVLVVWMMHVMTDTEAGRVSLQQQSTALAFVFKMTKYRYHHALPHSACQS